jgi:hypothetical protein
MAELQWFITEQVEEEKTVREIVAKLRMVSHDAASVLDIDRELGGTTGGRRPSLSYSGKLLASSVVGEALEDALESGNCKKLDDAVWCADQTEAAASSSDGDVRGNDLAQTRAVDVVHAGELEQHVSRAAVERGGDGVTQHSRLVVHGQSPRQLKHRDLTVPCFDDLHDRLPII